MTDKPYDADPDADVGGHRSGGHVDTESADDAVDVEGHGRFGQFLTADGTVDDPYPTRPPDAPER